MTTILTEKKNCSVHWQSAYEGSKHPNENDEDNEKNNFDENYKKILSVIAFIKHKHNVIHEARASSKDQQK